MEDEGFSTLDTFRVRVAGTEEVICTGWWGYCMMTITASGMHHDSFEIERIGGPQP